MKKKTWMYSSIIALLAPLGAWTAADTEISLQRLLNEVSAMSALEHLKAFQKIAEENDGNRAAGTSGHELSGHYVAQKLLQAGYKVEYQPFDFIQFKKLEPAQLESISPESAVYEDEKDFNVMAFSPSGSVSAEVVGVDLMMGPGNTTTSGCEAEDFTDFPVGKIALIQRGTCSFMEKAQFAEAAGASAVMIFNQGDSDTKLELFGGTLSAEAELSIPVISVSYPFAEELLKRVQPVLSLQVRTQIEEGVSFNVIAESQSGNANNVVMIGAHLDSVEDGPGINDNGSGSAAILEVALKMKAVQTKNKLRFAWWGAEELGLVGSTRYVASLSDEEKSRIALYLNFDMVGSPNYMLGVFDGDGSKHGIVGPEGSSSVEELLHMFFSLQGTQSVETEISNRSDYAAFAEAGIPFGGTFTGAEGAKTAEEAKLYGGEAGKAYDPCYHSPCDTLENISLEALELNSDAIAYLALTYGHSTASLKPKEDVGSLGMTGQKRSRTGIDLSGLPMHVHGMGDVSLK